jgi:hypothetical protein
VLHCGDKSAPICPSREAGKGLHLYPFPHHVPGDEAPSDMAAQESSTQYLSIVAGNLRDP